MPKKDYVIPTVFLLLLFQDLSAKAFIQGLIYKNQSLKDEIPVTHFVALQMIFGLAQ